jgi:uncharacterized protein YuzE
MRIKFDSVSGAFYIRIRDGQPFEALELGPGAYVHIDEHGAVLQVEFLSLAEFAELTAGGLELPDRIEDPANWEPSELTKA